MKPPSDVKGISGAYGGLYDEALSCSISGHQDAITIASVS